MNILKPQWKAPAHVKAYTTLRDLWTHLDTGDQETKRPPLKTLLQLPQDPIWLNQKHTTIAVEAVPENKEKIADASFTSQPNRICVILTADCLPILICHQDGTQVAAIHAGWRGLANGIIETTLSSMRQPTANLMVWLGPAIGPQKFEVGEDVFDAFTSQQADSQKAFVPHTPGKWLADLYALARMRLQAQGITHIYGGDFCTYTQNELFFSYRRDKGLTGRMASLIWIESPL